MSKARRFLTIALPVAIVEAVLLAASVAGLSASAWAATSSGSNPATGSGNGLKIGPVRVDLTIDKGTSRTVPMFVENVTASPVTVSGVINDFEPSSDESGEPRIILDDNQHAAGNSFKSLVSSVPTLSLAPNERQNINITITVPPNAASGGYYGAIRFSPGTGGNNKNVALTASVGTLFLIRVPGNITEKLSIESFGVVRGVLNPDSKDPSTRYTYDGPTGTLFSSGPLAVQTRFRNFGNIHVQPFGKIDVKNFSGKIIQTIEINDTQPRGSVLPASIRRFNNPIDQHKLFGRYTVEGSFGYGSNGDLLLAKKTFYVIPYPLIGGVLLAIVFAVFILPRLIHAYNESVIRRSKQPKRKK